MARISEVDFRSTEELEVALSQAEYDDMINNGVTYTFALYNHDGTHYRGGNFDLTVTNWQYDADTFEWVGLATTARNINHSVVPNSNTPRYEGIFLYSSNGASTTLHDGAYFVNNSTNTSSYELNLQDGPLAGETVETFNINSVPGYNSTRSIRWDADNPNDPFSGTRDYGSTGDNPPVCLVRGTKVKIMRGEVPIEQINTGDLVLTKNHGYQPVLWIGSFQKVGVDKNAPIQFDVGTLRNTEPLLVSRQHRVLVSQEMVDVKLPEQQVLVPAVKCIDGIHVKPVQTKQIVHYYHLLCDRHEIIFAESAAVETLHLGAMAKLSIGERAYREISENFPDLVASSSNHASLIYSEYRPKLPLKLKRRIAVGSAETVPAA